MPVILSLIKILYNKNKIDPASPSLVPLTIEIMSFNEYLAEHPDYDFKDPKCPTESSITQSKKTPHPLDLYFYDEYFYNHQVNAFVNAAGNELSGIDILDYVFRCHVGTVDTWRGRFASLKMKTKSWKTQGCDFFVDASKKILRLFGRTLEEKENVGLMWFSYPPEAMKLVVTERIDLFGYKASKTVILLFCSLVMVAFLLFRFSIGAPATLKIIAHCNILALSATIVTIWILDDVVPELMRWFVNRMLALKRKYALQKIIFRL
ncbi:MAG: hypothetical protein ABFD69_10615 [Candidatus Sumerlaeia bacterium]